MDYINAKDMLENGIDTANVQDGLLAIMLANQWLNDKKLPIYERTTQIPKAIKIAGVKVASAFLAGTMFQGRDDYLVTEKTVKAKGLESSKKFSTAAGDLPISQDEVIALQLIAPFLPKQSSGFKQVRITR